MRNLGNDDDEVYPVAWVEGVPPAFGAEVSGTSDGQHSKVAPMLASHTGHGLQKGNHEVLELQCEILVTQFMQLPSSVSNLLKISIPGAIAPTQSAFVSATYITPLLLPLAVCPKKMRLES